MPTIPIKWTDNTAQLRDNLRQGLQVINQTRDSAERMTKALSGERLLQSANNFATAVQRIGGVERLTNAERERGNALLTKALEKYHALGQQAPAALREIQTATASATQKTSLLGEAFSGMFAAFSAATLVDRAVSSLVSWTKEAISGAGAIIDLSNKLGVSTDAIQKWTAAGKTSGVSTEEFADAAYKLGLRIAGGSGSVKDALDDLGLSWRTFRALQPEAQFDVLIRKLEDVTDIQERNRLGNELFGRSWASIAAAVADGYSKIADSAEQSSRAQLEALDKLGDKWDEFILKQQTKWRSWAGQNVAFFEQVGKLTKEQREEFDRLAKSDFFQGPARARAFALGIATQGDERAKPAPAPVKIPEAFSAELAKARAELAGLTAEQRKQIAAAVALGKSTDEITNRFGISEAALKLYNDQVRQSAQASKEAKTEEDKRTASIAKMLDEIRRLEVITPGLREQVGALNDTELKAIDIWLKKTEAAKKLREELEKLQNVRLGHVDTEHLPGDATNELGGLRGGFAAADEAADARVKQFQKTQTALQSLSQAISMVGSASTGATSHILSLGSGMVDAISNVMRAVDSFKTGSISAMLNVGAAAFQLGLIVGNLLGRFFGWLAGLPGSFKTTAEQAASRVPRASTGGLVTDFGIQRFAVGGMVQPSFGRDSVHIMAEPGEVILNRAQQQNLASGMGGVSVVVNLNPRGVIGIDGHALRRWGRELAPAIAEAISQNKNSSFTKFRAATGQTS